MRFGGPAAVISGLATNARGIGQKAKTVQYHCAAGDEALAFCVGRPSKFASSKSRRADPRQGRLPQAALWQLAFDAARHALRPLHATDVESA